MKISPDGHPAADLRPQLRGYDADEVRTYLNLVAEEVAALQRERDRLDQEVQTLQAIVEEHRQRETILKNTLLTAQRVSEEIKENARKQARERGQGGGAAGRPPAGAGAEPRPRGGAGHPRPARAPQRRCAPTSAPSSPALTHILDLQEEAELEDNLRFLKRREEAQ